MTKNEKKEIEKAALKIHKNISKAGDGYVVRTPDGKTKNYKTLAGAVKHAEKVEKRLDVPMVVTANVYFWRPAGKADGRRSNEKRRQAEINGFCEAVERIPTILAEGSYSESCNHVYRTMRYRVDRGKGFQTTNLTGLIGECRRWGLILEK